MRLIYNFFIYLLYGFMKLYSIKSKKSQLWVNGQKNWKKSLPKLTSNQKVIWFHTASYGEFEQAEPVVSKVKQDYPNYFILVTFFSPSGKEPKSNYQNANHVMYLPIDTPNNTSYFLNYFKPEIALFVKYEFWYNYLKHLKQLNIPTIYFSSLFRSNQYFFNHMLGPFQMWALNHLKMVSYFFVQDMNSKKLLEKYGITKVEVAGDTRVDKVIKNSVELDQYSSILKFKADFKLIIIGSAWKEDINLWTSFIKHSNEYKFVIAPHEIEKDNINYIKSKFLKLTTQFTNETLNHEARVLILDTMGMLKHVYQYADLAYVGGGFGKGIHNILEPAVFNIPVLYGPNHIKAIEAIEFKERKIGFEVKNENDIEEIVVYINDNLSLIKQSNTAYFEMNKGATESILKLINQVLN